MLLLCHRLKKWWKSAVQPEAAQGYQEAHTEPSLSIQEYPEGGQNRFSTTLEYTHPSDNGTLLRKRRQSLEKVSTKLRKRLSKKSKLFRATPRKNLKRDVRSLFSSESPRIVLTPAPFCDFGGSLMSERGYDSDAQFVHTPMRASQSPGRLSASASTDQGLQHTGRDNRVVGLSILSEQSHDLVGSDFDSLSDKELLDFEKDEMRSKSISRQSTQHSSQARDIPTQVVPTGNAVDYPTHKRTGDAHHTQSQQILFAAHKTELSTPLSSNASESSGRDFVVSQQAQELGFVPMGTGTRLPSAASSNSSNEHMSEITVEKRRQQARHTNSVPTSIDERLASSRSSNTSDERMSEIVVEKKRQRLSSEVRSIHLCDLNIPKALASPSITPHNLSQSFEANRRENTNGSRSVSDQGETPSWQKRSKISSLAPEGVSREECKLSSNSSVGVSDEYLRPNVSRFSSTSYKPTDPEKECLDPALITDRLDSERNLESKDGPITEKEYRKGIFTERFDLEGSLPLNAQFPYGVRGGDAVPRRISIGWMSGGRRLGYGYTMVDSNEENSSSPPGNSNAFLQNARDHTSIRSTVGDESREDTEQQPTTEKEETSSKSGGVLPDTRETTHQVPQRRWSGATTVLRKVKSKESIESASTIRSLWSKFARRARKDRTQTPDNVSTADRDFRSNSASSSITEKDRHVKTLSLFGKQKSKHKTIHTETRYPKELQSRPQNTSEANSVYGKTFSVENPSSSPQPVIQADDVRKNGHLNNERQEDV